MIQSFYKSDNRDFTLARGDCRDLLKQFNFQFDMIFADPPYFLSNGGISVHNGKQVCVDKGGWDKGGTPEYIDQFNKEWLTACTEKLKPNGTIWVSGTYHNIFSIATQLTKLGYKILNVIVWVKPNPAPNLSCRVFTHAAELVIWARKTQKSHQTYNYELMKKINNGRQMTDVWVLPTVAKWEKELGKHPTQKPLSLLYRIILASTHPGEWILDPFCGSATTGVAAGLLGRKFLGIDREDEYLNLAMRRRKAIDNPETFEILNQKIVEQQGDIKLTTSDKFENKNVLIGRVSTVEQWGWIEQTKLYNLPFSKIKSMPLLMDAEYVLLYLNRHPEHFALYRLSHKAQKQMSKEEISSMASDAGVQYHPSRDKDYLMLKLNPCDTNKLIGKKRFLRPLLIHSNEWKEPYWLKSLDCVLEAFE